MLTILSDPESRLRFQIQIRNRIQTIFSTVKTFLLQNLAFLLLEPALSPKTEGWPLVFDFTFFTFVFTFMLDSDPNLVPEPECIPVLAPVPLRQKVAVPVPQHCEVKWDKELEDREHVQESLQNTQSEHGGSRQLKYEDGESASGEHCIRRTILPKRSYMDHRRELPNFNQGFGCGSALIWVCWIRIRIQEGKNDHK